MLVDPGNVGLAFDGQIVLRWRFFFQVFFWPVPAPLASAEIFRRARLQRLDSTRDDYRRKSYQVAAVDIPACSRGATRPSCNCSLAPSGMRGRREDRVRAAPAVSCAMAPS